MCFVVFIGPTVLPIYLFFQNQFIYTTVFLVLITSMTRALSELSFRSNVNRIVELDLTQRRLASVYRWLFASVLLNFVFAYLIYTTGFDFTWRISGVDIHLGLVTIHI